MPAQQLILAIAFLVAVLSAVWFAGLWVVERRSAQRHRRAAQRRTAAIESAPGAYLAWSVEGEEMRSPELRQLLGSGNSFAALCRLFSADDAELLTNKVQVVRTRGDAFSITLTTRDGSRALLLDGVRARAAALDLLWVRDVTAQTAGASDTVLRQAAAEQERDGLRAMVNALPLPIWRRGADLNLVQVNRAYLEAVGSAPRAVLVDQPELDATGPDRARAAVAASAAQSHRGHVVVAGERRLLELTEVPLPDGAGVVGYAVDHSTQDEVVADLARHVEAHADVLENVAVAVAIYGPDTRLIFHNTAYARLWDVDAGYLNTHPLINEELEHLRERRRLPEFVDFRAFRDDQKRLFTSLIQPQEDLVHLPDGRTLRKRVAPHPFGGLLFTYEDVTDSLTLERNYNTLIEVQSRTLDNLYEGVALIGADGRLKLCNPAYARLWRLSDADVEGEPHIADLVDKSRELFEEQNGDWDAMRERVIGRMTAREPRRTRLERTDGSVLESAIVPLPDGMVLLSYIDVTDRYRVERMLRERNDALQAADELKTEFIANVSYKLRTPLNTIIGFSEILNGDMFGELNERQSEYSEGILRSSEELLELINDILDLATIEAGYMELDIEELDIREMLQMVTALTRERALQRQLNLSCECDATIGTMRGDERRLKQVLFNLVSNAAKFTPAGGAITLAAERAGADVVFSVSDTGIGIPQQEHERVLKMFERGSYPNTRQNGAGAGLGLSLVKSFIELHGGTVELLSKPDLGTTVICRVPAAASATPVTLPVSGAA